MALAIHSNALLALGGAVLWGGGDFCGGMGVRAAGERTSDALRFVIAAHAISLIVLVPLLWLVHAPPPHGALLFWGLAAGGAAALSVTAFYIALSRGAMGASAAVSGLLAAAIPVVVSSILEGAPSALRLVGFATAAIAIWLIAVAPPAQDTGGPRHRGTMALAIGAGTGFGLYFVALRMDNPLGLLEPLALSRAASLTLCVLFFGVLCLRLKNRPPRTEDGSSSSAPRGGLPRGPTALLLWAFGVFVLDTAGNALFVAATRMGRLDVASVLSSLYPAATILLAAWRLHERPTRRQFAGMAVALAAVLLITL